MITSMATVLRIGTRRSPLALWQAGHVAGLLQEMHPEIRIELVKIMTQGDKILDVPLAAAGGKGLFLKELEQALLDKQIDLAVHSMKDVPVHFPEGLHIPAVLMREDPRDAFVSNHYETLQDLPQGAVIGTCSLRRQSLLRGWRSDLMIKDLRGNVNTRLRKLDDGEFDAIILAVAGLKRLGFDERIRQAIDKDLLLPAVGQGIVGVECRISDQKTNNLLKPLHHLNSARCLAAERAANAALDGGCQVPLAVHAEQQGRKLLLQGFVGRPDGSRLLRARVNADIDNAAAAGEQIAADLLQQGAKQILDEVYQQH